MENNIPPLMADLSTAICKGDVKRVADILSTDIDVSQLQYKVFTRAPKSPARVQIVRAFIEDGRYDFSVADNAILQLMCRQNDTECARELLKCAEVDPRANNLAAIIVAITNKNLELFQLFADADIIQKEDHQFCFIGAIHNKFYQLAKILLYAQTPRRPGATEYRNPSGDILYNTWINPANTYLEDSPMYDPNKYVQYPIEWCKYDADMFVTLCEHPLVDPSFDTNDLLRRAISAGSDITCQILLQDRRCLAKSAPLSSFIIRIAIDNGNSELARIMLSLDALAPRELRSLVKYMHKRNNNVVTNAQKAAEIERLLEVAIARR